MLEELEEETEREAVQQTLFAVSEDVGQLRRAPSSLFECELDATDLADDLRVLSAHSFEPGQTLFCFLHPALVHQPARGLGDEHHSTDQNH